MSELKYLDAVADRDAIYKLYEEMKAKRDKLLHTLIVVVAVLEITGENDGRLSRILKECGD